MKNQTIEISTKTIFTVLAIIVMIYIVLKISILFILIFLAFILMSAMEPSVVWFERKKIARGISVLLNILIILVIISFIIFVIVNPIIGQMHTFINTIKNLPGNIASVLPFVHIKNYHLKSQTINSSVYNYIFTNIKAAFFSGFSKVSATTIAILTFIAYIIFIAVLTIYMLLYKEHFYNSLSNMIPSKNKNKVMKIMYKVESQLGLWFRGQLIISFIIGFLFWLYLTILGIPFALPVALFAAFCEVIPFIGPIIAGTISVIAVLFVNPDLFIFSIIAVVLIQQFESNLIAPKVMHKVVGINPLIIIIGIFIGLSLGGILGALITIPFITVIQLIIYDVWGVKYDNTIKND